MIPRAGFDVDRLNEGIIHGGDTRVKISELCISFSLRP